MTSPAPTVPAPVSAGAPAGLTVEGLTKRFVRHGKPVVDAVSFSAPEGGITTLLGPSGSGKSTILRLVAGLEAVDAGRIVIGGRDTTGLKPQDREIGFVFQSYALFAHMTVRQNVAFGLDLRGTPADETTRKVDELLETVELGGYGHRLPKQLSGGQRQRVAFARALAVNPKLLLLDEPFAALDAKVRLALRAWLRRFHEERSARGLPAVTTILVTHDQEEAMELSEHIVVLSEGRVAQAGSPREVYDHPASPFVASFVSGANVFPARVERGRVATSSFHVPAPAHASQSEDGAQAHAYVRPHEVRLRRHEDEASDEPHVVVARVERLAFLGSYVRVTLRLPDGNELIVERSKREIDDLHLAEGDRVMADLRDTQIFVGDYAI